jgi:hypothetical protein
VASAKHFHTARRLRAWSIAGCLAVAGLAAGPALAAGDTRLDDSAKKVGNNFGEMLKGMGPGAEEGRRIAQRIGKKGRHERKATSGR